MMRTILVAFAVVACGSVATAAARYAAVTGAGMGIDNDRSAAHDTADSQAQTNLENACPGALTTSRKIFDQCSQVGDTRTCNVNYSGICQIGG
jgi:hypothetical protein